jgi:hypothetical protein
MHRLSGRGAHARIRAHGNNSYNRRSQKFPASDVRAADGGSDCNDAALLERASAPSRQAGLRLGVRLRRLLAVSLRDGAVASSEREECRTVQLASVAQRSSAGTGMALLYRRGLRDHERASVVRDDT